MRTLRVSFVLLCPTAMMLSVCPSTKTHPTGISPLDRAISACASAWIMNCSSARVNFEVSMNGEVVP